MAAAWGGMTSLVELEAQVNHDEYVLCLEVCPSVRCATTIVSLTSEITKNKELLCHKDLVYMCWKVLHCILRAFSQNIPKRLPTLLLSRPQTAREERAC